MYITTGGEVSVLPFISHLILYVHLDKFEGAKLPFGLIAGHSEELCDILQQVFSYNLDVLSVTTSIPLHSSLL